MNQPGKILNEIIWVIWNWVLEITWDLEFGILGLLQQSYDFHVVSLWEHIDEAGPVEEISPLRKEPEVPREGGRLTRDIDDFFGFRSDHMMQDRLAPCPGRVENDEIGCPFFPI
jgi:hypothetical protein